MDTSTLVLRFCDCSFYVTEATDTARPPEIPCSVRTGGPTKSYKLPRTRLVHDHIRNPGVPKIGVRGKFTPEIVASLFIISLMTLVPGRSQKLYGSCLAQSVTSVAVCSN